METLIFVGVSTAESSIMTLFPRWADELGISAAVEGYDLPVDATPADYRQCVDYIASRPDIRGALVTTHKAAMFEHAHDRFRELDGYAQTCREISCIVRRGADLHGFAKDPITSARALEQMLPAGYWAAGGQAICLGAGGAGVAITVRLLTARPRPQHVVLVDRDARRIAVAREVHASIAADHVSYAVHRGPHENRELIAEAPPRSLIINATGLGKDRPGSPLDDATVFPRGSTVWDLNYRGDLTFLSQARAQAASRDLAVFDGWSYFLHGWTEAIAEVFGLDMTPERLAALAHVADQVEPASRQA
jgi:shikimate dehydrogenase